MVSLWKMRGPWGTVCPPKTQGKPGEPGPAEGWTHPTMTPLPGQPNTDNVSSRGSQEVLLRITMDN